MSAPMPCLRHPYAWLAYCEDCTAWHLSRQFARRAATAPGAAHVDTRPRHLTAA